MKVININKANLEDCVRDAQRDRVVIMRNGKPVALIVGVKGMDLEQVELGSSDQFWTRVRQWRKQKTISRAELESRLARHDKTRSKVS